MKRLYVREDTVGLVHGLHVRLQADIKFSQTWLPKLRMRDAWCTWLFSRLVKSDIVEHDLSNQANVFLYNFRREVALWEVDGRKEIFILPFWRHARIAAAENLERRSYTFSLLLTLLMLLLYSTAFLRNAARAFLARPHLSDRHKGTVLTELNRIQANSLSSADFLIDGRLITADDVVFFSRAEQNDPYRMHALNEARRLKYKTLHLVGSRRINFGREYWATLLWGAGAIILVMPFTLLSRPSMLPKFADLLQRLFHALQVFSYVDVRCYYDLQVCEPFAEAIVARWLGVRTATYFYSDLVGYEAFMFSHCPIDAVFVWGPLAATPLVDRVSTCRLYIAGCRFNREYNYPSIPAAMKDVKAPKLVFYDNSISDTFMFNTAFKKRFLELILECRRRFPQAWMALKPKAFDFAGEWDLLRANGVHLFDCLHDDFFGTVCAADLNIGLALNSAVGVGLANRIPGLYFDLTGCRRHPFHEYMGRLVFDDEVALLDRVNDVLIQGFSFDEFPLIEDYATQGIDGIQLLREYIVSGKIDQQHELMLDNQWRPSAAAMCIEPIPPCTLASEQ